MARGRRRAPVAPAVLPPPGELEKDGVPEEDVDDFVMSRHRQMAEAGGASESDEDNGSDLGVGAEASVMDIAVSESSEEDGEGEDDSDDEGGAEMSEGDDDGDTEWGGRRRTWYGADTADYEIMDDDEREEALKEEGAEALRLQKKARSKLSARDFMDSDDDFGDGGREGSDEEDCASGEKAEVVESLGAVGEGVDRVLGAAPELPILLRDLRECVRELPHLMSNCEKGRGARVEQRNAQWAFHVSSAYAINIAFYLALRTEPEAAAVDVREHPVIGQIVRFRELRKKLQGLGACGTGLKPVAGDEESDVEKDGDDTPVGTRCGNLGETRGVESEEIGNTLGEGVKQSVEIPGNEFAPDEGEIKKRKRGKRKRNRPEAIGKVQSKSADVEEEDDDAFVQSVVGRTPSTNDLDSTQDDADAKQKALNRIVGSLERERQSRVARRTASADLQSVRQDPGTPKHLSRPSSVDVPGGDVLDGEKFEEMSDDLGDDEAFTENILAKKAKKGAKSAKKKAAQLPHVYTFDDGIKDKDLRRRASAQVLNNRGLTRYRPRDKKTPRAKNREAFKTAVKKRKSVVRDSVDAKPDSYGGEASGINMRARKGSRLANV